MIVQVEVTQDKINLGDRGSSNTCPIAMAIHPLLSTGNFSVYGRVLEIRPGFRCFLPREAASFILSFDEGRGTLSPFTFPIDIPEKYLRKRTV